MPPSTEFAPPSVAQLCDARAWPEPRPARLILYMTFGVVLACVRVVSMLACGLVAIFLPRFLKPRILRALRAILGMQLHRNMTSRQIEAHVDGCIVASNHVSLLDNFLVGEFPSTTILVGDPVKGANPLSLAIGYLALQCSGGRFWTIGDRRELVRHLDEWRKSPHGTTLYVTPEGTINNGRGLFRFEPGLLARGMPVVPAAVRLTTPFGLNPHPVHDSGIRNIFRLLMMPWLCYDVICLPRMVQAPGQTPQQFARQVQQAVADYLGIVATDFSRQDKHVYRRTTSPISASAR